MGSLSKRSSIATVIQEKRRLASLHLSEPDALPPPPSPSASTCPHPHLRQPRSRGATRMGGLADLASSSAFDSLNRNLPWNKSSSVEPAPSTLGTLGMGEVVMTPTTEEWRSLGGLPGDMRKFRDDLTPISQQPDDPDEEDAEDDSDDSLASRSTASNPIPFGAPSELPDSPLRPATKTGLAALQNRVSPVTPVSLASASQPAPSSSSPSELFPAAFLPPDAEPTAALPTLTSVNGIIHSNSQATPTPRRPTLPTLSALSSLSLGTSSPTPACASPTTLLASLLDPIPSPVIRPCSLGHDGTVRKPIDPRTYSALTNHRTISSFAIEGSAGEGAYGVVKHVREIAAGPDGPRLIIKYIIKQKILADCWKRHKILGPIPVEIHVLDHLRRVSYRPPVVGCLLDDHRPPSSPASIVSRPNSSPCAQQHSHHRTGHPNICGILDYFEDPDYYYLVMPCFGDGQDLFDYIESSPSGLSVPEVVRIFGQILDAVCFIHERNIVHRDIKDENVILDRDGNVQLIDFGSAAYVREGKKFDTFSGTLDFAAPEVLRGERHDGKEIDVWALGVLLYVLMCGECPFWNADEASAGIEVGTRAAGGLKGKDPELVEVLKACLCLEPEKRDTAHQLAARKKFAVA